MKATKNAYIPSFAPCNVQNKIKKRKVKVNKREKRNGGAEKNKHTAVTIISVAGLRVRPNDGLRYADNALRSLCLPRGKLYIQ